MDQSAEEAWLALQASIAELDDEQAKMQATIAKLKAIGGYPERLAECEAALERSAEIRARFDAMQAAMQRDHP
jgi:prefoldin subunit 5